MGAARRRGSAQHLTEGSDHPFMGPEGSGRGLKAQEVQADVDAEAQGSADTDAEAQTCH